MNYYILYLRVIENSLGAISAVINLLRLSVQRIWNIQMTALGDLQLTATPHSSFAAQHPQPPRHTKPRHVTRHDAQPIFTAAGGEVNV